MTTHTAAATTINTHECAVLCKPVEPLITYARALAVSTHDINACPFTIGLFPDATVTAAETTDLVYSIWFPTGRRSLDTATVEWVIGGIIKRTADYSVITFGNTLVVHLDAADIPRNETLTYTATITLEDSSVYTMTGHLIVGGVADTCVPRLKVAEIGEPLICVRLLDAIDINMNAKMVDVTPFNAEYTSERASINSVSFGAQGFFDYYDDITEHKLLLDSIVDGTTIQASAQHPYGEFWVNSQIVVTDFTIKTSAVDMVEFSVSAISTGEVTFVQPP